MEMIYRWNEKNTTQEWRKWRRKRDALVLFNDDLTAACSLSDSDFKLTPAVAKEHEVIKSFLHVRQVKHTIAQCEYYFRRFPFHGLPVMREEHLRNNCEFYLSQFYIGEERIDQLIKKTLRRKFPSAVPAFLALLKAYKKQFDRELKDRHNITHSAPFDDAAVDKIFLTRLLSESDISSNNVWKAEHISAYRKASREWSAKARRQGQIMSPFVDAMARAILDNINFLSIDENADVI